jgi:hypothetical protein
MRHAKPAIVVVLCVFGHAAHATTFSIDYTDVPVVDPAANFDVDCLGATEAPDCGARATALETELTETLAALSVENDAETRAVFEAALAIDSPAVDEVALHYFVSVPPAPVSTWDRARLFFFGTDPTTGVPSAKLFETSTDEGEVAMGQRYRAGRPDESHDGWLPGGSGESDPWARGSANDFQLDLVEGFLDDERFAPAERLLMVDRFVVDFVSGAVPVELAITGFVTDAPEADVRAHFTALFGREPYPPLDESEAELETLANEMQSLQAQIVTGNAVAIARMQEINEEMAELQQGISLATRMQLGELDAKDHVYWSALGPDAFALPFLRSVSVGPDPHVGRTVIRYFADDPTEHAVVDGGDEPPDDDVPVCACGSTQTSARGAPFAALFAMAMGFVGLRRRQSRRNFDGSTGR